MEPRTIEDWAAVIGIISAAGGGLIGLVKLWIINPLSVKIDELNGNFASLNIALNKIQSEFDLLAKHVNEHDITLATHGEQIHTLFNKEENK